VPDSYADEEVAVPENTIRSDQLGVGGVATARWASTASITAVAPYHQTLTPADQYYSSPGSLWTLPVPVILAVIRLLTIIVIAIVCVIIVLRLLTTAVTKVSYDDPDNPGNVCDYYTVQSGLSLATLDTCNHIWKAPPVSGLGDVVNTIVTVAAILGGAFIVFKYILPELRTKSNGKG
jgi:hypothetical protein